MAREDDFARTLSQAERPMLVVGMGALARPDGGAVLGGRWPDGVATWTTIVVQVWIVDALGPQGATSTNALLSYTP